MLFRSSTTQCLLRRPIFLAPRVRALHTTLHRRNEPSQESPPPEIPPDFFIQALENTAKAPWLHLASRTEEESLQRVYVLTWQIFFYLSRPQKGEDFSSEQYLLDFIQADVPRDSEMYRARLAAVSILKAVRSNINSISQNSPLRKEQTEIFDLFGALTPLFDQHLPVGKDVSLEEWKELWETASPILLATGMKLDEKGYGFDQEGEEAPK